MAEPAGRMWRRLALAAALGLVVAVVVLVASFAVGDQPRPELFLAVGAVLAVLAQLVRETAADRQPAPEPAKPPTPPGAEFFSRLRPLGWRLEAASRDGSKYDRNVRPTLARLAVERLRQKYGIDPGKQPVQARQVLGEQLWSLTIEPVAQASPAPSHAELSTLLALIEAL